MNLTFLNGTQQQQQVVQQAIDGLLHLTFDRLLFSVEVEFVDNPEPSIHNEFAWTEATEGFASVRIRSDFPALAPLSLWGSVQFANEVAIHELGHAIFVQLSPEDQDAVLALFGWTREEWEAQDPDEVIWEDRIIEGIAETFKDAFLQQDKRVYPNRTNVKLPISRYAEFRRIFREASYAPGGAIDYTDELDMYQYDHPFDTPPHVVISTHPDGGGVPDPAISYTGNDTLPHNIYAEAGTQDWILPLAWAFTGLYASGGKPYPGFGEGLFDYQFAVSDQDNVHIATDAVPGPGWHSYWQVEMLWFYDDGLHPDYMTAVAMIFRGWKAEDGDMDATWPGTPMFDGFPKVYYAWEPEYVFASETFGGFDPTAGGDIVPGAEHIEVPFGDPFPGLVELPVLVPVGPAYVGVDWTYSNFSLEIPQYPFVLTAEGEGEVPDPTPIPGGAIEPVGFRSGNIRTQHRVSA